MQVTFICIRSLICWRRSGTPLPGHSCTRRPQLRWATRFWHPGLGDWWGAWLAGGDLFRLLNFKVPVCGADLWLRVNFCRGAILKWDMKSGNWCGFKDKICSCIAKLVPSLNINERMMVFVLCTSTESQKSPTFYINNIPKINIIFLMTKKTSSQKVKLSFGAKRSRPWVSLRLESLKIWWRSVAHCLWSPLKVM